LSLRRPVPTWQAVLLGLFCVASVLAAWWLVTRGASGEDRLVGSTTLPSPEETFGAFKDLYFEFELNRNIAVTLRRVTLGFLLSLAVGVPLGIAAGCFPRIGAFLSPVIMFGRNIPLAAVLPLLIFIVPGGEERKVAFIFVACVAFVVSDSARAIRDVDQRYIDTAYTLGASRWQAIIKVLVPLSMPSIFASARLLFGLAFGYIMLAESIKYADDVGGLGYQIQIFQRRGLREHIYLIILIIPLVALLVDQFLFWMQRSLFPYQYGGLGLLNQAVRGVLHAWDDVKSTLFGPHGKPAAKQPPAEPKPAESAK
jgi:NitT/TauT family transport system permease protein